ncbi:hypothetical protein SpCBS45565_g06635 [Spizellomyces sp. 'palustris']|nr:hypothetical protein SpCBS45565_g06635 [Spizellomyces sp. 'palustris']
MPPKTRRSLKRTSSAISTVSATSTCLSRSPSPPPTPVSDPTTSTPDAFVKLDHIPDGPCTTSWSYYSAIPKECAETEAVCLGVDEAGRGPVLGPMVYAVSYVPVTRKDDLAQVGFADSKQLKEEQRDQLFKTLSKHPDWIGWAVHVCSPQDISECMLRRAKHNLNELAHDTTIDLIARVLKNGVHVTEVFVDTVGPPDSYKKKLEANFPRIDFTVTKKADSLFPCVSAASICAKVTRDAILRGWVFAETGLDDVFSRGFGSGYPSDPNTIKWLNEHIDRVFGYPRVIRFSWSTCAKLLEDKGVCVRWPGDDEDRPTKSADIRGLFGRSGSTVSEEEGSEPPRKKPERDPIFRSLRHVMSI